jgi:hypothetical protein
MILTGISAPRIIAKARNATIYSFGGNHVFSVNELGLN